MNTTDYTSKVDHLLDDTGTYKKVDRDPTKTIESKLRQFLQNQERLGTISKETYRQTMCNNGIIPRFYALPKIHKDNIPMRPIVSFCGSTLYNFSKFFKNIIAPLVGNNEFHVKNSHDFIQDLSSLPNLSPDDRMVSFDVTSLFTNTPLNLALQVLEMKLNQDRTLSTRTKISIRDIMYAIRICVNNRYLFRIPKSNLLTSRRTSYGILLVSNSGKLSHGTYRGSCHSFLPSPHKTLAKICRRYIRHHQSISYSRIPCTP